MNRRLGVMMAARPLVSGKNGKQRHGKGFSGEELKKAGLSFKQALRLGVPVDLRRETVHDENVGVIKEFLETRKKTVEPEKRRKSKS